MGRIYKSNNTSFGVLIKRMYINIYIWNKPIQTVFPLMVAVLIGYSLTTPHYSIKNSLTLSKSTKKNVELYFLKENSDNRWIHQLIEMCFERNKSLWEKIGNPEKERVDLDLNQWKGTYIFVDFRQMIKEPF